MKILSKKEFKELMKKYPNGGIVFSDTEVGEIHITDGDFGATTLSVDSIDEELFDYDWNIEEYSDHELFYVYERKDILLVLEKLKSIIGE